MDEIEKRQYKNLRICFNDMLDEVLGDCYYNDGEDVYMRDALACRDVIAAFSNVKESRNIWRFAFFLVCIIFVILSIV